MSTVEAPVAKKSGGDFLGTGRRKTSVARVRVRPGKGKIVVNTRPLEEFFVREQDRRSVLAPLEATGSLENVDVSIQVHGGGVTGQAGACKLGIARALRASTRRWKRRCAREAC